MSEQVVWLIAFAAAYCTYCIYWGVTCGRMATDASEFFLADRRLPPWIFVLTVTGASFSGWVFLGHPDFIFRDGFQFAQVSLCAITIPLTGVLFFKRQWLLGKGFGYVTPGEMFADYFDSELMRLLVVLVALVFAVPFLGMQLSASGYLMQVVSHGRVDGVIAMWVLTAVVFLYVCFGGMRAVAYVGTLQALLLASGIVAVGLVAYGKLGGFGPFNEALAKLGASTLGPWGGTAQGYNGYFEVPGVIQFTAGLGKEAPVGGPWTAAMILTYCFALMGIQAAPAFSIWAFSSQNPRGFAPQQVWASAAALGVLLVVFGIAQGMGAHFLGASGAEAKTGLAVSGWLPELPGTGLVAAYVAAIAGSAPWFGGLLAVCALAAVQVMAATYASTTGTLLARDLYRHYVNPAASDRQQKLFGRLGVGLVIVAALLTATYAPSADTALGALAIGFGAQLLPSLAAICWFPRITREGATVGLVAGLLAVVFTEPFGAHFAAFVGIDLPWGRWPWTIHSAGWGIFCNVIACAFVSFLGRRTPDRERRLRYHRFLAAYAHPARHARVLRPVAWALTLAWLFFAVGPGVVIGNDLFGAPNGGIAAWRAGVPSLWVWQILWWALGVVMIWFLAYRMELSTYARRHFEFHVPGGVPAAAQVSAPASWHRRFWAALAVAGIITVIHWMFG